MGDPRRFDLFARLIKSIFSPTIYPLIADIAGGKGHLQTALREHGFKPTTFDKRAYRKDRPGRFNYRYRYFDDKINETFNLLVGMHPDEATDVIITQAAKRSIPFAVCPCCVMPETTILMQQYNYPNWLAHLRNVAERSHVVSEYRLKMAGRAIVLIGQIK